MVGRKIRAMFGGEMNGWERVKLGQDTWNSSLNFVLLFFQWSLYYIFKKITHLPPECCTMGQIFFQWTNWNLYYSIEM